MTSTYLFPTDKSCSHTYTMSRLSCFLKAILSVSICSLLIIYVMSGMHMLMPRNRELDAAEGQSQDTPEAQSDKDIFPGRMQAPKPKSNISISPAQTHTPKAESDINISPREMLDALTRCDVIKPTPGNIVYRHKHWQVARQTDDKDSAELVVYSAFYDDRPITGILPWIRVHGVVKLINNAEPTVHCQVWYDGLSRPYSVNPEIIKTGRDHQVAGDNVYGQRLYSCPLSAAGSPFPSHISLVLSQPCAKPSSLLPIMRFTSSTKYQHEFAVCVESSFGSIPVEVLVEWFEAYRLFGVTQFNIYNGSLSADLDPVFEYYASVAGESGDLLSLRQLPPTVDDVSEEAVRLSSPTSLNDCMLRRMYSARFLVVVDYDEIIVPRRHANYSAMLAHVDKLLGRTRSHHTYSFRNAYFFQKQAEDVVMPKYLRTLRLRTAAPPNEYKVGMKSFVDPRSCKSLFNHYCWIRFEASEEPLSIDVPVDVARSHHYRHACPLEADVCARLEADRAVDDIMMTYEKQLDRRVRTVLRTIGKL